MVIYTFNFTHHIKNERLVFYTAFVNVTYTLPLHNIVFILYCVYTIVESSINNKHLIQRVTIENKVFLLLRSMELLCIEE